LRRRRSFPCPSPASQNLTFFWSKRTALFFLGSSRTFFQHPSALFSIATPLYPSLLRPSWCFPPLSDCQTRWSGPPFTEGRNGRPVAICFSRAVLDPSIYFLSSPFFTGLNLAPPRYSLSGSVLPSCPVSCLKKITPSTVQPSSELLLLERRIPFLCGRPDPVRPQFLRTQQTYGVFALFSVADTPLFPPPSKA